MFVNLFFRRPFIHIEKIVLEMAKHRKISTTTNEKSENELQRNTKNKTLNYKLWKKKMEEKNKFYTTPLKDYKIHEFKLNSMKDKKKKENDLKQLMNQQKHLTPLKKDNRNEKTLSKTANIIIGLHITTAITLYTIGKRTPPQSGP